MRPRQLGFLLLAALWFLTSADPARGFTAGQEDGAAVLLIDGEPIPRAQYAAWLVWIRGEEALASFARERCLERVARRTGLEPSEAEVLARIEADIQARVERAFGGDRAAFEAELRRLGRDPRLERLARREEARSALRLERLVRAERVIDEAALRAEWARRYGPEGRLPLVSLCFRRVVPPSPPPGTGRDEAARLREEASRAVRDEVEALRRRVLAGEDFAALAREHSEDPSATRGGKLEGSEARRWRRLGAEPLRGLRPGEVTEPFSANGGWALLWVREIRETPFEAVRDALAREIRERPVNPQEIEALLARHCAGSDPLALPELLRSPPPDDPRIDRAVAHIAGEAVTRRALGRWLARTRGLELAPLFAELRLVERLAREAGIEVTTEQALARVAEDETLVIETAFRGDRERWLADLAAKGLTEEQHVRRALPKARESLIVEAFLRRERIVTDEDVRREWERRYGPGGRSPRLRWIAKRIPVPPATLSPGEREEFVRTARERLRAELESLRARIESGEDFAELARRHSDDPATRDRGGRPEGPFRAERWPEEVRAAIADLGPGELAGPIEAGGLLYLFEFAGVRVVPLDKVREALRRELHQARPNSIEVATWIAERLRKVEVRPLPALFE